MNTIFTTKFRRKVVNACHAITTIYARFHRRTPREWCDQRLDEIKVLHQLVWWMDGQSLSDFPDLQDMDLIALIRIMDRIQHPTARKLSAFARGVLTDNKHRDIQLTIIHLAI